MRFVVLLVSVAGFAVLAFQYLRPIKSTADLRIAIIDTGINLTLAPELKSRIESGWNFYDSNDDTSDLSGHGTQVALFAAKHCSQCKIIPIKIAKSGATVGPDDLVRAILYALEHKAVVINLSLGTLEGSQQLENAVAESAKRNVPIVAAAGTGIPNPFKPMKLTNVFPQAYQKYVLVISGSRALGEPDFLSNFGPEMFLSVPAPEDPTTKTVLSSSFAAAIVSGAIAEYLRLYPGTSLQELRDRLRRTAQKLDNPAYAAQMGNGLFDEKAFLAKK